MFKLTIDKCLEMLKKDETKQQIKEFLQPFFEILINEIFPYLILVCIIILAIFLLNISIVVLLLRKNGTSQLIM